MKVSDSAERLKELMQIYNIRQSDFVEKTGIPKSAVSMYLSGHRFPRQDRLTVIADAYNVSEAWLMGYDVPMDRNLQVDATSINARDERDITKDLDNIMRKLTAGEEGPAAYDGEELDPEAAELFKDELEIALRRLKIINKEKYTPKKYKK